MVVGKFKSFKLGFKILILIGFILSLSGLVLTVISLYEPKEISEQVQYNIDIVSDYINIIFVLLIFFGIFMFVLFKLFIKKIFASDCLNQKSDIFINGHIAATTLFLIINAFTYIFLRIFSIK